MSWQAILPVALTVFRLGQIADLAEAPIIGRLPIDPAMTSLADAGEIEKYEHEAYAALAEAFIEAVPITEPTPTIPWMG